MSYNGGGVVAMKGKNCVAIACDLRLGVSQYNTIATDFEVNRKLLMLFFEKVFRYLPTAHKIFSQQRSHLALPRVKNPNLQ